MFRKGYIKGALNMFLQLVGVICRTLALDYVPLSRFCVREQGSSKF